MEEISLREGDDYIKLGQLLKKANMMSSGVDAKTLAGILGHTKASFTLDTYTHTTGDMQKRAAEIVGGFLTDYLGEEMNPWQSRENTAAAPSV